MKNFRFGFPVKTFWWLCIYPPMERSISPPTMSSCVRRLPGELFRKLERIFGAGYWFIIWFTSGKKSFQGQSLARISLMVSEGEWGIWQKLTAPPLLGVRPRKIIGQNLPQESPACRGLFAGARWSAEDLCDCTLKHKMRGEIKWKLDRAYHRPGEME